MLHCLVMENALRDAWLKGSGPRLGAKGEALAWALRVAWRAQSHGDHGMLTFVQQNVPKMDGEPPRLDALSALFKKIDRDEAWFPGKLGGRGAGGRPAAISQVNQAVLARSAMALKKRGVEPTYTALVARNPEATRSPHTGEPVQKKSVYKVLRSRCYDDEAAPEDTWVHAARNSKAALTLAQMQDRLNWAVWMESLRHQQAWFFRRVVWTDICNKILPRTEKKAAEQALARKGKRGWGSKGCKGHSRNLVGKKEVLKQNSWGTVRVFYAPVLARGKLHVALLGNAFPGETPAGAAMVVAKVKATLNVHHRGASQPDVVFTDRGQGFFAIANGQITSEYAAALREHGLKAFMGSNAARQPGDLKELMLHETAVAWLTQRLTATTPARAWEEPPEQFGGRLKDAAAYVNDHYGVEALCRALPARVRKLREREGGRLSH